MKKIFSILVVAFFLAATFSSTNNYLAFAEEDSDVVTQDKQAGGNDQEELDKVSRSRSYTIYCNTNRNCPSGYRCRGGICGLIPLCNSRNCPPPASCIGGRCIWNGGW